MAEKFKRFDCPFCDRGLKIPTEHLGKKILCPRCNTILLAELDGDRLTLTAAPQQNELFGPPVHRDFIKAEVSEADPFLQDESDLNEDLPNHSIPMAEESHSKAEDWARKHSKIQTRFDDCCIRAGIGLVLVGVALLLVPWARAVLLAPGLPVDLTVIGFVASILGVGMLSLAKRRRPKKMFGVLFGLAIPVAALALLTPAQIPIEEENKTRYVKYSNPAANGTQDIRSQNTIDSDRPSDFVGLTGDVPTGVFIPRSVTKAEIAKSENPKPQFSPSKPLPISPVDNLEKTSLANSPNIQSADEQPEKRSAEQISTEFRKAMRSWVLHPALADSSKTSALNERSKYFEKSVVNRRKPHEQTMRRQYSVTDAAGRNTVFGNAIYRTLPIHGIDVASKGNVPELFVPIHDGPEFDDTLAWDENFFLVGFNVNVKTAVLGVQGVFAPFENGQLNMERQVVGPWYGRPPAGNDMQSVTSYGNPVYGVVVYRDKLDIVGLSLVVGL